MNQPIAICGIDTSIGKSIVTGLLARHLLLKGKVVITQKLVQTGCEGRPEDIVLHRKLMGAEWHSLDEEQLTCPYCFAFPASPHLAAARAGTEIDPAVLTLATSRLSEQVDQLLIEGVGGLLVPLTRKLLLLDYLAEHNYPVILVTTPRLGSINHTLLSLEALKQRKMKLLGLACNLYDDHSSDHSKEILMDSLQLFREQLGAYGFPQKVVLVPNMRESCSTNWDTLFP